MFTSKLEGSRFCIYNVPILFYMTTKRIRDPIHDLIIFHENSKVDQTAWNLLRQPEFQRLRRIRQLGVSEFVYPSATHTRFAHSIGVFHNARRLIEIIRREIDLGRVEGHFEEEIAKDAVIAALLHDIGHGPFSHAFEEARKAIAGKDSSKIKKHESFTADMIESSSSNIPEILSKIGVSSENVAKLLRAEVPENMYHSVVSSSFDADRLDYFQRDRYMTGVGAGAIDLTWLMDNARVAKLDVTPAGEEGEPIYTHSFCLGVKARDAAEDFLLSRYRLFSNVYLHKTTRGFEQLISAFFRIIAEKAVNGDEVSGLRNDHPLLRFFANSEDHLESYANLDDFVVVGAMQHIAWFGDGAESGICRRFLSRERLHCLDVQTECPQDLEAQRGLKHKLNEAFKDKLGHEVFYDTSKLSIYGEIGADDSRAQKRLMIMLPNGRLREITDFNDATIQPSNRQRSFERYYFLDHRDFEQAEKLAAK